MEKRDIPLTSRPMTQEERNLQAIVLEKYRKQDIIPAQHIIARNAGVAHNTAFSFMKGNSFNGKIRDYLRKVIKANFKDLPEDLARLLSIWDETTKH